MTLLRDNRIDFAGAIERTAAQLGLAPMFVEKDYWVTEVLRALHNDYPGSFIFKGGTSLSKGYALIDRFSEDVDVLVIPASGDSARAREQLLQSMTESVAGMLGVNWIEARPAGRGKLCHRADVIVYPRTISLGLTVPVEDRGVLLETGFAGGEWPTEMVTISPLVTQALGLPQGEYQDADTFPLRTLNPARTLLEKTSLLHHIASTWRPDGSSADVRCGRHYYDIYRLLDHQPTLKLLEDRPGFERILADMQAVSAVYNGATERPEDGFASGPAFSPPPESDLREWLRQRYDDAAGLLPARVGASWPSFGQVLARVSQHAHLL